MKLNLGCGTKLKDGYLNIDMLDLSAPNYLRFNLAEGLPVFNEGVDYIISLHFLEHLYPWERDILLKSIYKTLVPGGTLRLVLPDFRKMVTAYINDDWAFFDQCLPMGRLAPLNTLLELCSYGTYQMENGVYEHKAIFDAQYTVLLLKHYGFEAKEVPYSREIDSPEKEREVYSFVVEGLKPQVVV